MTPKQAKQWLPIITAFANGETIQVLGGKGDTWVDVIDIHPSWPVGDYRIKPEPLEGWIVKDSRNFDQVQLLALPLFETKHQAEVHASKLRLGSSDTFIVTHMREVVE